MERHKLANIDAKAHQAAVRGPSAEQEYQVNIERQLPGTMSFKELTENRDSYLKPHRLTDSWSKSLAASRRGQDAKEVAKGRALNANYNISK